jgi:hypothetical protein
MRSNLLLEKATRCNFKGCEHSSDAAISHRNLCREHLVAICRERLDATSHLLAEKWLRPGDIEAARTFVIECAMAAREVMQDTNDLALMDQAQLMEILLCVEDLSQRLLRLQ